MEKGIFKKIIDKELSADIVYEDENTLAFLDINPDSKGHTLVIPKDDKIITVLDLNNENSKHLMETIVKVSRAVKEGTGADGFNVVSNNGRVARQMVDHLHFHIIPRYKDKGNIKYENDEEKEIIKNNIKDNIKN